MPWRGSFTHTFGAVFRDVDGNTRDALPRRGGPSPQTLPCHGIISQRTREAWLRLLAYGVRNSGGGYVAAYYNGQANTPLLATGFFGGCLGMCHVRRPWGLAHLYPLILWCYHAAHPPDPRPPAGWYDLFAAEVMCEFVLSWPCFWLFLVLLLFWASK